MIATRVQRLCEPELKERKSSFRIGPGVEVISQDGQMRIYEGTFGVGVAPIGQVLPPHMRCGSCGSEFMNGARCVRCGAQDDD